MAAYNYYQPYPYYQMYPQVQTQIPQVPQSVSFQPQISQQTQAGMIWVSGEREAQMYPVAPNNAVTLWSQAEPVVYLKQADATGKPTLKAYDLVERTAVAEGTEKSGKSADDYARKADLAAVVGAMNGFDKAIGSIKADIEAIKSDMYGIAGKKKSPARKQEDDADE